MGKIKAGVHKMLSISREKNNQSRGRTLDPARRPPFIRAPSFDTALVTHMHEIQSRDQTRKMFKMADNT